MLSELNRSLAKNSSSIEHVIVVDGNGIEALPAELAANATVVVSARAIGQAAARNLGLLVARGEWITSADDDVDDDECGASLARRATPASETDVAGEMGGVLAGVE